MKDIIEYKKRFDGKRDYEKFISYLKKEIKTIELSKIERRNYREFSDFDGNFITTIKISPTIISKIEPYVRATVEKIGPDIKKNPNIEYILIKNGFEEFKKPVVQ
jgi:hypothetical protein